MGSDVALGSARQNSLARVSDSLPSQSISYNQEQICLLAAFYPGNQAYNFQATISVTGGLNLDHLDAAITHVIARQEMLRTTIVLEADGYRAHIHRPFEFKVVRHDLSALPEPEANLALTELVHNATQRVFDLTELPLLTIHAVRLGPLKWTLIQVEHHVIHDGWSVGRFWRDVAFAYNGFAQSEDEPKQDALPASYQQFVAWQRARMEGPYGEQALDFWCDYLQGSTKQLSLGDPNQAPADSLDGRTYEVHLSEEVYGKVRVLAKNLAVSNFVLLFSLFGVLVASKTDQTDFAIGTAVGARTERDLEPLVGMVVNTIPVRMSLEANADISSVARQTQASLFKAMRYQDVPLSLIIRRLKIAQKRGYNPVFQHCFSFHDSDVPRLRMGDAVCEVHEEQNQSSKFEVNVVVIPPDGRTATNHARILWQFARSAFSDASAKAFIAEYGALLDATLDHLNVGQHGQA